MVARKRNRSSVRLSILERHTQRRLQSIKATTGCQIFVIEKETAIDRLEEGNAPSLTIINSERSLKPAEIEALPQKSRRINLVDLPPRCQPLEFLAHSHQFDASVLMRDGNLDASTFVQSLLYGLSQQANSLMAIPFSRWGAARQEWQQLAQKHWQHEIETFSAELDLSSAVGQSQAGFLRTIQEYVDPHDDRGHLVMAADGCNIILKIRCRMPDSSKLIPKLLAMPLLGAGFCQQGGYAEVMLIQRQRQQRLRQNGLEIFLLYSPRGLAESTSLEEAG